MEHHKYLRDLSEDCYFTSSGEENDVEFTITGTVIAFRGSDEATDWVTNLRLLPWWSKGLGWCPSGFVKTADMLVDDVMVYCLCNGLQPSQLSLTGHSLGGAIALIVGAKLALLSCPVANIVTFGAPRCGRLKVLDGTDVTMYRNGRDVVPIMPPLMRRHNKLVQLNGDSGGMFEDHKIANYVIS